MLKNTAKLRDALRNRQRLFGLWLQSNAPSSAEILAAAGFSWLGLDCEHTSADIRVVEEMARALSGLETSLLVRVTECNEVEIRRCLDVGAAGVIVPFVETAAQARKAVAAAKYPPTGRRGFCFGRMNRWGRDFDKYAAAANNSTIVIVMIESKSGVENIAKILAVDGVDAVFVGPYDLSGSYGVPGQLQHPAVVRAQRRIIAACRRASKAVGQHLVHSDPAAIGRALAAGYNYLCLEADTFLLAKAAQAAIPR